MKNEELILFPYIRLLEKQRIEGGKRPANIGIALETIIEMESEHTVDNP